MRSPNATSISSSLSSSNLPKPESIEIREVWSSNLKSEFALIRSLIDEYPYIAMDTEFPGVILRPIGSFKTTSNYHCQTLKSNVDLLKPIQLGLTFSDLDLNHRFVFQFNFREFDPSSHVYATDSIDLLRDSRINFERNLEYGIDVVKFGELLMTSGVVLNDSVQWITFHLGYGFGYLLKI